MGFVLWGGTLCLLKSVSAWLALGHSNLRCRVGLHITGSESQYTARVWNSNPVVVASFKEVAKVGRIHDGTVELSLR